MLSPVGFLFLFVAGGIHPQFGPGAERFPAGPHELIHAPTGRGRWKLQGNIVLGQNDITAYGISPGVD